MKMLIALVREKHMIILALSLMVNQMQLERKVFYFYFLISSKRATQKKNFMIYASKKMERLTLMGIARAHMICPLNTTLQKMDIVRHTFMLLISQRQCAEQLNW